jgi:hypothetical protein
VKGGHLAYLYRKNSCAVHATRQLRQTAVMPYLRGVGAVFAWGCDRDDRIRVSSNWHNVLGCHRRPEIGHQFLETGTSSSLKLFTWR